MFDETPNYSSTALLKAVEKAQESLLTILGNSNLELVVIEDCDQHPTVRRQYNQTWENKDPQNWNTYFNSLSDTNDRFIVAIRSDNKLLGLCLYNIRDVATRNERIRIHAIERNEAHDVIKGVCVAGFCEVAAHIAKALKIEKIAVLQPHPATRPSYTRHGFSRANHNEYDLPITGDTQINWGSVFASRSTNSSPPTP